MTFIVPVQKHFSADKPSAGSGPVVVKVGGSALVEQQALEKLASELALLAESFGSVYVVHGGGPHINQHLKKFDIEPKFVNGLRVTDDQTLMTVFGALAQVNAMLVDALKAKGVPAVGLHAEPGLFSCKKKGGVTESGEIADLGWVGDVVSTSSACLNNYQGKVPVISSIGWDALWNRYNLNADTAALALAVDCKAETLIFVTDVPGVLACADDKTSAIESLGREQILTLIESGVAKGGMIPKLLNCAGAIDAGVKKIAIVDGACDLSVIKAAFGVKGAGTFITGDVLGSEVHQPQEVRCVSLKASA